MKPLNAACAVFSFGVFLWCLKTGDALMALLNLLFAAANIMVMFP